MSLFVVLHTRPRDDRHRRSQIPQSALEVLEKKRHPVKGKLGHSPVHIRVKQGLPDLKGVSVRWAWHEAARWSQSVKPNTAARTRAPSHWSLKQARLENPQARLPAMSCKISLLINLHSSLDLAQMSWFGEYLISFFFWLIKNEKSKIVRIVGTLRWTVSNFFHHLVVPKLDLKKLLLYPLPVSGFQTHTVTLACPGMGRCPTLPN